MIDVKTSKLLRGIAILMVVFSHYAGWMYVEPLHPQVKEFISTLGVYGVDIFFLLSGYGLVKSYQKNGINLSFVVKRLTGSYIPYILIIGFFAIIDKNISDRQGVINLFTGYDYWYMYVLFGMYILFMVFYKLGFLKEILVSVGVIAFSIYMWKDGRSDFWVLSNGAFIIGIILASVEIRFPKLCKNIWFKAGLLAIGIIGTAVFAMLFEKNATLSMEMCRSMFITVAFAGIAVNIKGFGVVLPALGTYSLYIYLLHTRLFWKIMMIKPERNYIANTALTCVLTLVISLGIGFAIDYNLALIPKLMEKRKEG